METPLIRSGLGIAARAGLIAVLILGGAANAAWSQNRATLRGKVVDAQGQPVAGANVLVELEGEQPRQDKTNDKGEFGFAAVPLGNYRVTASKDGLVDIVTMSVVAERNPVVTFTLKAPEKRVVGGGLAGITGVDAKTATALQALAKQGLTDLDAGRDDAAIAALTEVTAQAPNCVECHFGLGVGYLNRKQYAEGEAAFKKVLDLKPDDADAHVRLARIYNAQGKFDLAAQASANAAKLSATPEGGGNAEALYNQGVALFNGGKFAEAKTAFEGAAKADPKMALAHYQVGMTALNLGDVALAVRSLETYLKLDPNGPRAAEVKASLPALQGMIKK